MDNAFEGIYKDMYDYRLELEKIYSDEMIIIKHLKTFLFINNYCIYLINQLVYDFYLKCNINMHIDIIKRVYIADERLYRFVYIVTSIVVPYDFEENDEYEPLSKNKLKSLNKFKLNESLDDCCSICLDSMELGNTVIKLGCKHIYHEKCIEEYLSKYNHTCPMCKKNIEETD